MRAVELKDVESCNIEALTALIEGLGDSKLLT